MKILHYLIYFILFFAIGLSFYILYLLFIPLKPIEFTNSPFPVLTKTVRRGEHLTYRASHCKYTNVGAEVSRSLVDSIQYTLPTVHSSVPKGCDTLDIMTVTIPKAIPPGEYYLNITITYHLNPFRTFTTSVKTETFTVM